MKNVIQIGAWCFEIKQIRAIKAPEFGMPYTANALITIVNGTPAIEGLLSNEPLTRQDFKDIRTFLISISSEKADWRRFGKDGKKRKIKKVL